MNRLHMVHLSFRLARPAGTLLQFGGFDPWIGLMARGVSALSRFVRLSGFRPSLRHPRPSYRSEVSQCRSLAIGSARGRDNQNPGATECVRVRVFWRVPLFMLVLKGNPKQCQPFLGVPYFDTLPNLRRHSRNRWSFVRLPCKHHAEEVPCRHPNARRLRQHLVTFYILTLCQNDGSWTAKFLRIRVKR